MVILAINFISIVFELLICSTLYKKISYKNVSATVAIVVFICSLSIQNLNNFYFLSESPLVILISFFCMFLVSFMYQMKIKARIWGSVFLFITGGLSEFIIAFSSTLIFNVDTLHTQTDPYLLMLCTASSKFLSYIIIRVLKFDKNHKNAFMSISYDFLPLPLATLFILVLLYTCCYEINNSIFRILAVLSALLLIAANIFMLTLIEKHRDYIYTKTQLDFTKSHITQQIAHYEALYKYQVELKKFRHDLKNRLIGLLGLLKKGNLCEAVSVIEKDLSIIYEPNNVINSGNPILDAILYSKINAAKEVEIPIKTSVKLNAPIIIDPIEIGIILGNALDNAIEAVSKITSSDTACKEIFVNILSIAETISIEIRNPVKKDIDVNNLSSTKLDKSIHGMGIKSMRALVEKHNGDLYFSCKNNQFIVNIIISNVS